MSKYKKLTSLFYEDKDRYQSLYNERFHSESCTHLPLSVAGAPAFFLTTSDMAVMIEKILSYNADLTQILGTLPEAALDMLKEEIIIEEIMVTNDIEGVRSTRKEIADALEASKRKDRTLCTDRCSDDHTGQRDQRCQKDYERDRTENVDQLI